MPELAGTVITSESRLFQLDFGYIDCVCSILFCLALAARSYARDEAGRPMAWTVHRACHCFGAFAFFADYVLYYHIQCTRTVTYPAGDVPMTPLGSFLFFFWFDWINGAVIVMWAMLVCEDLLLDSKRKEEWKEQTDRAPFWMLAVVPLWFWSTPPLSRLDALPLDNRLLLVERPSEKGKYWVLMALFVAVMRTQFAMRFSEILRVLLSGVGCGLIHHAPLFFFGMRGYSSPAALAVTLLTEWPAIMTGLFVITKYCCSHGERKAGGGSGGRRTGLAFFAVVLAAGFAGQKFSGQAIIYELMPYIPAQHYQKLGQIYMRTTSCLLPRLSAPLPCDPSLSGDLWVAAAAQKSSAVMTALISVDIARACGKCVGVGDRPSGAWPNPIETPPPYDSDVLLAIANVPSWPDYAARLGAPVDAAQGRRARCIVTMREPLARLVSTFLYALAGREPWFREHGVDQGIAERLRRHGSGEEPEDVAEAVAFMLERFGLATLRESHGYIAANLKLGCTPIKYERLKADYNGTMATWMDTWGISADPALRARLVEAVAAHNPNTQTAENHHATGLLRSARFKASLEAAFLSNATVAALVRAQRAELGYDAA